MMRDFETNEKHALAPEPGDYWHEMLSPILVVLQVDEDRVIFCRQQEDAGPKCWRWNAKLTEVLPRDEFYRFLHYQSPAMKQKYWADVVPRGHLADAKAYAMQTGD